MSQSESEESSPTGAGQAEVPPSAEQTRTGVDKTLGPTTSSDLAVVQADLEQARRLAASYEAELAGKTTQFAELQQLFEKARQHLIQLQGSVTKLRDERHRLANQCMEVDALRAKLTLVTIERDRLLEERNNRVHWQD